MGLRTIASVFALVLVAACGGGGGGGSTSAAAGPPPAPVSTTVSGTVAANTALGSYEVQVFAAAFPPPNLEVEVFTATARDADGQYSVTFTTEQGPPFFIQAQRPLQQDAEPQYPRLSSIALRAGTANVTPLTELMVSRLLNRKLVLPPEDDSAVSKLRNVSDADLSAARREVLTYLLNRPSKSNGNVTSPVDVAEITDFVSMPLSATPGDLHFEALKRLHDSLMDSETIHGVEEHMLFGNDPPADLSPMLAFDFMADCNVFNTDNGTLPKGATRIVLNEHGATLGTLDLAFQSGTQLDVLANQFGGQTWAFTFGGGATFFFLGFFADQLLDARVLIAGGSSSCVPQMSVPTPRRLPSLMALIKRFTQAVTGNGFLCSDPIVVPGFQSGPNQARIEANGALRINGAPGLAFHLPSMDITYRAQLVVTGSSPMIRTKSLRGARAVKDGSDQLELFLDNAGQLTSVFVARPRIGVLPIQSCGRIV